MNESIIEKPLKNFTIDELEKFIEEQKSKLCDVKTPFTIGTSYLIRTVTMIYTGKLVKIYPNELVIVNAAWIPETQRWADSVAKGVFKEVEPYPPKTEVILMKGAILDASPVQWELPSKQQ